MEDVILAGGYGMRVLLADDHTLVRAGPLQVDGAGISGVTDCCYEQCATRRWWTGWG